MFKKMLSVVLAVILLFSLVACGSDKVISGVNYETKGLLTLDEKSDKIQYKVIIGNVIWGVLLFETIVFPVYFFGFSMYEPVGLKGVGK